MKVRNRKLLVGMLSVVTFFAGFSLSKASASTQTPSCAGLDAYTCCVYVGAYYCGQAMGRCGSGPECLDQMNECLDFVFSNCQLRYGRILP